MLLVDRPIREFVDAVESKEPTPGGGSVAALAGSLGAALTAMVGNLTFGRKAYESLDEATKATLNNNFNEVAKLKDRLNKLVDKDVEAFEGFMQALKMPKETEEEKTARKKAMERATIEALEVPLTTANECLSILKLQKVFANYGNVNAITDVGVGALMAYAGVEGALFNVIINLQGLSDNTYVEAKKTECDNILAEAKKLKEEVLSITYSKLA
ncbi:cyclodeaminase/cyclohydrolase family protein [Alkaliphilus sp. B6464]|uniref:cyclodeaminase/cyclohydrolase family protein n=1 Tax=Alkaliphilus sp. B6464 TaxID=2731219 RepID=UPI001BA73DF1|nr:cyclodeaminase/cyclohydrolase family protein [Alkaliphilus sp. B6464]QUH19696.1 cyclodeaminase/cyclohydrolase family protein [Alkaliphilus sp. B6464]